MNRSPITSLILAAALGWCTAASALSTDKDQPIEVEADYAEMDDTAGRTVYKGNVVVVQGSIRLNGDVLTVNYDDERVMQEVFVDGKPAKFKQRPDGKEVDIEGEALRVEYYAKQNLLYLKQNAKLTEGGKLFSGHEIVYDTERSVVTARKAEGASEGAAPGSGRVKVILPPSGKDKP